MEGFVVGLHDIDFGAPPSTDFVGVAIIWWREMLTAVGPQNTDLQLLDSIQRCRGGTPALLLCERLLSEHGPREDLQTHAAGHDLQLSSARHRAGGCVGEPL